VRASPPAPQAAAAAAPRSGVPAPVVREVETARRLLAATPPPRDVAAPDGWGGRAGAGARWHNRAVPGAESTTLLVVGAGPYGLAVAAHALEKGIETTVVGRPMGFWTEHMPEGMFLRSGLDWHLDASGRFTFEAFADARGVRASDVDPVPRSFYLDYVTWFQAQRAVRPRDLLVRTITADDARFRAELDDGTEIVADRVVAAPGVGYFTVLPDWAACVGDLGAHTADAVRFGDVAGARVLVAGGRQSAYEWAALLCDHGAEQVHVVHRHPVPAFDRVSWAFVDAYMDATVAERGWWRTLPADHKDAIARRFWEVGRLTLEWWLTARLPAARVTRHPGAHVTAAAVDAGDRVRVALSDGGALEADRVVFATGYRVQLAAVPYLAGLLDRISTAEGYPALDETFQTTMPGLYMPGFCATRDFGPFFGFTKACPAAATLVVDGLLSPGAS
jgi:cation diffusion facilitator CzcD-associated flavoprotein CzcO